MEFNSSKLAWIVLCFADSSTADPELSQALENDTCLSLSNGASNASKDRVNSNVTASSDAPIRISNFSFEFINLNSISCEYSFS